MQKLVFTLRGVFNIVVEQCSFYEVFLKVVFKKAVNYNEKVDFRKPGRKKEDPINRLRVQLL